MRARNYGTAIVLLAVYVLVTTATQAFAGIETSGIGLANPDNASDVFSVLGDGVFGITLFAVTGHPTPARAAMFVAVVALSATLLFRGMSFWLPLLPGLWFSRRYMARRPR